MRIPLSELFCFRKRKKSRGTRSGEYGACSSVGVCFVTKKRRILWDHFWRTHFSCSDLLFNMPHNSFVCIQLLLMPKWRPVLTRLLTFSTFSSVHLPHRVFLLKTACAIQTHELFVSCCLHTPHIRNKLNVSGAVIFSFPMHVVSTHPVSYQAW
jgi:hypothetical protein